MSLLINSDWPCSIWQLLVLLLGPSYPHVLSEKMSISVWNCVGIKQMDRCACKRGANMSILALVRKLCWGVRIWRSEVLRDDDIPNTHMLNRHMQACFAGISDVWCVLTYVMLTFAVDSSTTRISWPKIALFREIRYRTQMNMPRALSSRVTLEVRSVTQTWAHTSL